MNSLLYTAKLHVGIAGRSAQVVVDTGASSWTKLPTLKCPRPLRGTKGSYNDSYNDSYKRGSGDFWLKPEMLVEEVDGRKHAS